VKLPKISPQAWKIAAAVVALFAVQLLIYKLIWGGRDERAAQAETVVVHEGYEGAMEAAQETTRTVVRVEREKAVIQEITRRNEDAIKQSPGADTHLPDVAASLRGALCLRDAYRGDPACAAVRGPGGVERPAGADAGSQPAG
jgi:hypothetical protein